MLSRFFYLRSLKAKYQYVVIYKTIRAVNKDKQLAWMWIPKTMMMLKKALGEVNQQIIRNFFYQKSWISMEA